MTRIPEEHRAARDLYDSFVALGEERGREDSPRARAAMRRWRLPRIFSVVPVALLTLVAAAAAGGVLFDDDEPVLRGDGGAPAETRRAPNDAALAAARAVDPAGGLAWGLRLYPNATGGRCAVVGRVEGRSLGVVRRGRFVRLAADAPGACGVPGAPMLIARRDSPQAPSRSVLYGFVDRSVDKMTLVNRTQRRSVPVASDGSFLVVSERRLVGRLLIETDRRTIERRLG